MAALRMGRKATSWTFALPLLLLGCALALGQVEIDGSPSTPSNVPTSDISALLVQSALNFLSENSPTGHSYKDGDLISAQKLVKPPYIFYRLTLNLQPICKPIEKSCPREVCTIDVRQHNRGSIDIPHNSIQCTYVQPQPKQETLQDQEVVENIEKQIINRSVSLDHEVQASADHNDRPFIAVRATQSDYCPGCPYELNPSLSGLSAFRDQVLQSMDEAGVSDFKHKLISIVRVTRVVPPGLSAVQYQLLMEIGESNCLRSSLIQVSECSLQSNLPIKLCLVTFEEQPWLSNSRRIIKNNCTDLLSTDNEVNASIDPNSVLLKSASLLKEDDTSGKTEFYDQIAQEAQEVVRVPSMDSSPKDPMEAATEIEPVKEIPHTKIVLEKTKERDHEPPPKFSDKMKEFDEFLEDFNIPIKTDSSSKNVDVSDAKKLNKTENTEDKVPDSENKSYSVQIETVIEESTQFENPVLNPSVHSMRSKRSSIKSLENNKAMLRKLAIKAVELLDNINGDDKRKRVLDVIDTKRERQNHGIVYYMTVEVAPTDCDKKDNSTECLDEVILAPTQICKFDIATNEKIPLQSPKLLHYSCKNNQKSNKRFKRQIVGGESEYDKNDPEIQNYVKLGLQKYSANYRGTNEPMVSRIKSATVQVVAGWLYKITVDIGVSTCPKGTTGTCQLKADEGVTECVIEAWSQPWIDKGNPRITVECKEQGGVVRYKRSLRGKNNSEKMSQQSNESREPVLVGGQKPHDKNDPEIQDYVKLGLKKYSANYKGTNEPMIANIKHVTVQVVSGSLYKITVDIGVSTCPKGTTGKCQLKADEGVTECVIEAWSQPWKDQGNPRITVECKEQGGVVRYKRSLRGKNYSEKMLQQSNESREPVLVGGQKPHDKNDPEIQDYVKLGLKKYSANYKGTNEPMIANIKHVTVQVVSGKLYKITVDIGASTCPKGTSGKCQLKADEELTECVIEVWSQPWIDKGNPKITVECKEKGGVVRYKRSLRGKNYSEKMLHQSKEYKEEKLFYEFINKYNKIYATREEKDERFKIFKENLDMIEELQRNEQGTGRYGVTQFTDLTKAEFKAKHLGLKQSLKSDNDIPMPKADIPDIQLPTEFDWRHLNVVTAVKDQGQCGSCWAFSVTGNIEGQYAIKYGKLRSFSEQELIDCDKLDDGCNGGLPDTAYRAIEELGGLEGETEYPYEETKETCHFNKNKIEVSVVSGLNISSNETQMAQWLVRHGPMSIGINANAMQFYMGGVSHPFKFLCSPEDLDHGVLLVGYGIRTYPIFKKKMPYWLIKNSWGTRWGEQGYYRVYRGDGTCGVNKMVTSAVVG